MTVSEIMTSAWVLDNIWKTGWDGKKNYYSSLENKKLPTDSLCLGAYRKNVFWANDL